MNKLINFGDDIYNRIKQHKSSNHLPSVTSAIVDLIETGLSVQTCDLRVSSANTSLIGSLCTRFEDWHEDEFGTSISVIFHNEKHRQNVRQRYLEFVKCMLTGTDVQAARELSSKVLNKYASMKGAPVKPATSYEKFCKECLTFDDESRVSSTEVYETFVKSEYNRTNMSRRFVMREINKTVRDLGGIVKTVRLDTGKIVKGYVGVSIKA